ncbi:hypothetical protein [Glacieibacterium frigidum]|uniref:Uncharacterized protein n=1 Tax=Glacieibacterium frigidum TaxID=2593303 RepID=A0A552UF42_9SPHN|nr:hypothetical protein [Glacieibacterium frigidum]TRW16848.1 hypothetical protein FMM06_01165 [Glacieibacterium frigidum]
MALAERDDEHDGMTMVDRRRPGRLAEVSPHLIPLLRAEERAKLPPLEDVLRDADRQIDTGPGVVLGVGLGALLWAAIIAGGWSIASAF